MIQPRTQDPMKLGLGEFKSMEKLKEAIEIALYKQPLHFSGLFKEINASKHFIRKAVIELMLDHKLFKVGFDVKEELKLRDMSQYFSTNPNLDYRCKK